MQREDSLTPRDLVGKPSSGCAPPWPIVAAPPLLIKPDAGQGMSDPCLCIDPTTAHVGTALNGAGLSFMSLWANVASASSMARARVYQPPLPRPARRSRRQFPPAGPPRGLRFETDSRAEGRILSPVPTSAKNRVNPDSAA
jgi:hypothetical protein